MIKNTKNALFCPFGAAAEKGAPNFMVQPHRATARVLDILERLAASPNGLTLTELSVDMDAPKSSLFPIVHTLEQRRYLQQEEASGRYSIGPGALALSAAAGEGLQPIVQVMKRVVAQCQETCQLGILDHDQVLYLEKEDSTQAIRMISRVGNRLPANATAIGKALLSGLPDQKIRDLYTGGLPRLTEQTITDLEELLCQLRSVREGAIATEQEESTPQLACWAVPLRQQQHVFSALSVSVPLFRCQPEKVAQVCQCLLNAQSEIEQMAKSRDFTWSMN